MANLEDKFTEFQNLTNAQHSEVMDALEGISYSVAGTLEATTTMSNLLATKLDVVNTTLTTANTQRSDANTLLDTILTAIGVTNQRLSFVLNHLQDIVDYSDSITVASDGTNQRLGTILNPAAGSVIWLLASLTNQLEVLNTDIGHAPDATTTINELLQSIRTCTCAVAGSLPSAPTTQQCDDQLLSSGLVFYPTWTGFGSGVNIATWGEPLPDGITMGTIFGITEDNTELNREGGFGGVLAWVQSDAPNFAISPLSTTRYPVNTWVPLPSVEAVAFSVDNLSTITVTLCLPDIPAGANCYQAGSGFQSDVDYVALFGGVDDLSPFLVSGTNVFLSAEGGYTFTKLSGNALVSLVGYTTEGVPESNNELPVTTTQGAGSPYYYVRSEEPFSAQVCVTVEE